MASFSRGTSFTDGVTGDVTATKLHALVDAATPVAGLITDRTAKTSVIGTDVVLISDSADSNNLKKVTVTNLANNLPTAVITNGTVTTLNSTTGTITGASITTGTVATLNSTAATITTGTIPTLVATTRVTTGTGTAAAPAIVPTGDTNTGLFFPAADTIAFSEGGTESMRIDSSGNVGIGRSSPSFKLDVNGVANATYLRLGENTAVAPSADAAITRPADGTMALITNASERLRVDSSGNVGIGTSNPTTKLAVDGGSAAQYGKFNSNAANGGYLTFESSGTVHGDIGTAAQIVSGGSASDFGINARGARNLILGTNNAERLRVTSGGEVYIAGTTDQGAYNLQVNGTGVWGAGAYVNGSDSRIKEDIQPLTSGLDVVEKLNPVTYKYKETWSSDQSIQSGFIAQELLTALDGQIYASGVVQQGGAEGYYSVAYQNLIAVLTKAIQELKAENESLKTRVSALEAA